MRRHPKPAKVKVEAKLPVTSKAPPNEGSTVRDLEKRLAEALRREAEALEQQTATAAILRLISSSPTDLHPMFATIVESAARFCGADDAIMLRLENGDLRVVAHYGPIPAQIGLRVPLVRGTIGGRSMLERRAVHVADVQGAAEEFPEASAFGREYRHRTILGVPLLREDVALGAIQLRRAEVNPFTDKQIALLQSFADQAVIAIENVRLFTELQEKNRALTAAHAQVTEALDQQTATSEILRVISSSPTDLRPVFAAILTNARRLCEAPLGALLLYDGQALEAVELQGATSAVTEFFRGRRVQPRPPFFRPGGPWRPLQIDDIRDTEPYRQGDPVWVTNADVEGMRTLVAVPLVKHQQFLGTINVYRREVRRFSDKQIALLQTFADQAVIAIENVRLFTELQEKNRALTEAHARVTESLERQTATSEILRVISSARADAQPVFDTIVQSAGRLCNAANAAVFLTDGRMLYHPANYGSSPEALAAVRALFPRPLDMTTAPGIAILTRSVVLVPDIEDPSALETVRQGGRRLGFRSVVMVPMLREDEPVGALGVGRREPGQFSDAEVGLLTTFADQAVIAIENVRLFNELEARTRDLTRSVEQLTALGEVGRAVSSTLDLETVLTTIVSRAVQLTGSDGGAIFEYDDSTEYFHQRATQSLSVLRELVPQLSIGKGEGVVGRLAHTRKPIQVADIASEGAYHGPLRDALVDSGIHAVLAVPLLHDDRLVGALAVNRKVAGAFPPAVIELLTTFAAQSAIAIQNARLFRELEAKSRELEEASQHKSEFLANMSHELRTPLNAVIGFSEVLSERMFGELNDKQEEYLKDIHASGQHLLALINDVLDLSKIEAGRMELELTDFHLPTALDNALTLVRERAGRHGIALHIAVDERLEQVRADERKIRQVVLNLLSNAIKFTPEGGRIEVHAMPREGLVEVSVSDTGVGIAPEDQEAIFEEFRQVGTAAKKVEGTGLGLALSRKFVELHGGRIWVKSQVGEGSTFTFTLPLRDASSR